MKIELKASDIDDGNYDAILTAVDDARTSLKEGEKTTLNLEIEIKNDITEEN